MFYAVSLLICFALIGIDQVIKHLVSLYLAPVGYVDVIPGVLRFRYVENTGAIFGSFSNQTIILTVFSVLLLVCSVVYFVRNRDKSKVVNICLVLMISGGVGNIIDRIRLHFVIDFIEPLFVRFAVFNFADCLITVGAFALFFYLLRDIILDVKKQKDPPAAVAAGENDTPAEKATQDNNGTD